MRQHACAQRGSIECNAYHVRKMQVYTQTLRVLNTLKSGSAELTIKPGSSERYTVTPSSLRIRAGETAAVEVKLRVLKFAQRQKAVEQGHRDVLHFKVRRRLCCTSSTHTHASSQHASFNSSVLTACPVRLPAHRQRHRCQSTTAGEPFRPNLVRNLLASSGTIGAAGCSCAAWRAPGSGTAGAGERNRERWTQQVRRMHTPVPCAPSRCARPCMRIASHTCTEVRAHGEPLP